jgi:hypothetical protein
VAQAVARAQMARAGVQSGLGSASAAGATSWHFEVAERAAATGPLRKAARRAQRGLNPQLLWATARAARDAGRQPEEVWAEALGNWLALQGDEPQPSRAPRSLETRRQLAWRDIEETMAALRAG